MQIQINSDTNIVVSAETAKLIEADLHRLLDRFDSHLTRVEVHLSDENADKPGPGDKRCLLEARPKSRPPLTVVNEASDVQSAVSGAAGKMQRLLETTFGRLADKERG
jgi:ribosome-associated translation inhibitor RaiA